MPILSIMPIVQMILVNMPFYAYYARCANYFNHYADFEVSRQFELHLRFDYKPGRPLPTIPFTYNVRPMSNLIKAITISNYDLRVVLPRKLSILKL